MIHNDHLGTPQKMTDASGTVVWAADYKPFGEATVTVSTITNNLGFPGQYRDAETGLHYNYYRDYNPAIGGYTEADPIGILGGENHLYRYARNNATNLKDEKGLEVRLCHRALRGWPFRLGPFHHSYINLDGFLYGLHPANESLPFGPGSVQLEQLGADIQCGKPIKCLEEGCVNREILRSYASPPGYYFGFYDCRSWAEDIIVKCKKSNCCEK